VSEAAAAALAAGRFGYTDALGRADLRHRIARHYGESYGVSVSPDRIAVTTGSSAAFNLAFLAAFDPGDRIALASPGYPAYRSSILMGGGIPYNMPILAKNNYLPVYEDIPADVLAKATAMFLNYPNNPTGAVYSKKILREIADLAIEHNLVVFADEIYDKILYGDAVHHTFAALAPDCLVFTFNGLSKAYRLAGFRSGWMMVTGPRKHAASYIEGIQMLTNMRLCANVPAQHAIQTALGGRQSIQDLLLPGGRLLAQRDAAVTALRAIPGVSVVEPKGALYVFPKIDQEMYIHMQI
jgi:alanine-synthesizing transaminase